MDGFITSMVAPVMMTTRSNKEKDEQKKIDQKRLNKKIKKEESFEEEFAAVYTHTHEDLPVTYQKPQQRFVYH